MDLNLLMIFLTLSKTDLRGMQHIPRADTYKTHVVDNDRPTVISFTITQQGFLP